MTSQSIYTEYANLSPENIQWLDECGATWAGGDRFSKFCPNLDCVHFSNDKKFWQESKDYCVKLLYTHIHTGNEFCERVAEILGIEKPTFEKEFSKDPFEDLDDIIGGNNHIVDTNKKVAYPHKTYRILDSLDGIPLDKRIPLSEWIPPYRSEVVFVSGGRFYTGEMYAIYEGELYLKPRSETLGVKIPLDGHWMRIV